MSEEGLYQFQYRYISDQFRQHLQTEFFWCSKYRVERERAAGGELGLGNVWVAGQEFHKSYYHSSEKTLTRKHHATKKCAGVKSSGVHI